MVATKYCTNWVAEPRLLSGSDTLVALRVLSADKSSKRKDEIADLFIPSKLDSLVSTTHSPAHQNLLTIKDHFMEEGSNGSHLCTIFQLAGPSVASMSHDELRQI